MNETLIQALIRILPAAQYDIRKTHADLMSVGIKSLDADTDAIIFGRILRANEK
jgi:hypothetical protein